MKKNKGFTLIELLAVIIILAAVALVAFPILLNTIKNSEDKIDETTEKIVYNAAKLYVDENLNDYPKKEGNVYCVPFNDLIKNGHLEKGIIEKTEIDIDEKIVQISITDNYNYEIVDADMCTPKKMICTASKKKATAVRWDTNNDYNLATSYIEQQVGYLASETENKYDPGVTYNCNPGDGKERIFFVLETEGDKVVLIAKDNIGSETIWSNNAYESPTVAETYLKSLTSNWTVQVSMPTYSQIFNILNEDSNGPIDRELWLMGSLNNGYWTGTRAGNNTAFHVWSYMGVTDISSLTYVRPTITVPKKQMD